jgi:nucleoside-diphosphate-sugar epimerase
VRGYADIAAGWFGQTAALETISWEQFRQSTTAEYAESSWGHLHRSHYLTIEKSKSLLDYAPRYEPETAILESVRWLIEHDKLKVTRPLEI